MVTGLLLAGGLAVVAFLVHEARAEYPLIHLRVLAQPNIAVPALLISIYRVRDRRRPPLCCPTI